MIEEEKKEVISEINTEELVTQISLKIPVDLKKKLVMESKKKDVSLSSLIRNILRDQMALQKKT